jgi:hypothetical protein
LISLKKYPPLLNVVAQHAEEAASLRTIRSHLIQAPHVGLAQLHAEDQRLAAHLDGLKVAGQYGSQATLAALEDLGCGEVFTATVLALELWDVPVLNRLLEAVQTTEINEVADGVSVMGRSAAWRGLVSAFGWVDAQVLDGRTHGLLGSSEPFRQRLGLAVCGVHRVASHPDTMAAGFRASDVAGRAQAVRVAGQCGLVQYLPDCLQALDDSGEVSAKTHPPAHQQAQAQPTSAPDATANTPSASTTALHFEAARAAVLLGDRGKAVNVLYQLATTTNPHRSAALRLVVKLLNFEDARQALTQIGDSPAYTPFAIRHLLIQGVGQLGDASYVDWLLEQMDDPRSARVAAEAFSTITGLDLVAQNMTTPPPPDEEGSDDENPEDDNVVLEADSDLPWPQLDKLKAWWPSNRERFTLGTRYFSGAEPTLAHCQLVLAHKPQRLRMAAAEHCCLAATVSSGMVLFNTAAPAWRQVV